MQGSVPYLLIMYEPISSNFDKGVFRFPDVQAYAINSKESEHQGHK